MESLLASAIDMLPVPDWAKMALKVAVALGIGTLIVFAIKWFLERAKEKREKIERFKQAQIEAHNASFRELSLAFERFLLEVLQYPHLGVLPGQDDRNDLSADDRARRGIFFDLIASMCERAWLEKDLTEDIRLYQWPGWDALLRSYARKPAFRSHWKTPVGGNFDRRFEIYMRGVLAEA